MATNKKQGETLEEKLKNADLSITVKKGGQDFIYLWEEQRKAIYKLEKLLGGKFNIQGKGRILTLACQYLFNEIESEIGIEESDGEES